MGASGIKGFVSLRSENKMMEKLEVVWVVFRCLREVQVLRYFKDFGYSNMLKCSFRNEDIKANNPGQSNI